MGRYPLLELPDGQLGKFSKPRRLAAIEEAISWRKGASRDDKVFTEVFAHVDAHGFRWGISLGKPGKEAFQEKRQNVNDMLPVITRNEQQIQYGESFSGIWNELENIARAPGGGGGYALELIARFVIASAHMVAHEELAPGVWRLNNVGQLADYFSHVESLVSTTTFIQGNIPMRVFLALVDAIGLQEDTKYYTLNGRMNGNAGRVNNLVTTAGVIRYLQGHEQISWLVGRLSSQPPGVLNLTQRQLREYFPPLQ